MHNYKIIYSFCSEIPLIQNKEKLLIHIYINI